MSAQVNAEGRVAMRSELGGAGFRARAFQAMARSNLVRRVYSACRRVPVLGSLLHAWADRWLPFGSRVWTRLPGGLGKGLWFCSDPRFELGYGNGDHEPWVQEWLRSHLKPGDCFYDIGAHTGFFSLIAARIVGEKGLVVALEADPENAALLRAQAEKNQMRQVKVIEAAVWSACGQLRFEQASRASNRTEGHVARNGSESQPGIPVAAISLDDLIVRLQERAPELVKIDIEGAEWEALQGAQKMLREHKPDLICEVHDPGMVERIKNFLGGFGYTTGHRQPGHPRYPDCKQPYVWAQGREPEREAGPDLSHGRV